MTQNESKMTTSKHNKARWSRWRGRCQVPTDCDPQCRQVPASLHWHLHCKPRHLEDRLRPPWWQHFHAFHVTKIQSVNSFKCQHCIAKNRKNGIIIFPSNKIIVQNIQSYWKLWEAVMTSCWEVWDQAGHLMCRVHRPYSPPCFTSLKCGENYI